MNTLWTIARYTFLQQIRNRLYLVVALFACLLLGASVLLGALAADQELRVILDLGLATSEMFGLVAALLGAVTLVLEEMETKTIYLILTRPLPRPFYLIGRFVGLVAAVWATVAAMAVLHFLLLYLKGWETDPQVFIALPLMALKIMVMTALSILCSLAFSSAPTATVFSLLFWVLGHFGLNILNLRDALEVSLSAPWPILRVGLYAGLYTAACLALASGFFSRKEF